MGHQPRRPRAPAGATGAPTSVMWLLFLSVGAKVLAATHGFDASAHPAHRTTVTATLAVLVIAGSVCLLFRGRGRARAALVLDLGVTLLLLADRVHWRYVGDVTSLSELAQTWQLSDVVPSVLALLRPGDVWFLVDIPIAAALAWRMRKGHSTPRRLRHRGAAALAGVALGLGLAVPTIRLMRLDPDEVFEYSTTRREVAVAVGVLAYHLYDVGVQLLYPVDGRLSVTAQEREEALQLVRDTAHDPPPSPLTGAARGTNVIVVLCEALQRFPLGLTLDGQEVTPHLSAFAAGSLRFDNVFDQTYLGTTADAELTTLQSLHPIPAGVFATRYEANDLRALPAILASHGYTSWAAAASAPDFWNRRQMHPKYGFARTFFRGDFGPGPTLGMGLSDASFFEQLVPRLASTPEPFFAYLITMSNHHPYELPRAQRSLAVGPLEGTRLGAYLQSVHAFDAMFGAFVDRLRRSSLLDRSLVVVFGDHEAFWEAVPALGGVLGLAPGDAFGVWQARKRLTLLMRLPGGRSATFRAPAGQLDIAPTVLGLLGLERRGEVMLGRDLTRESVPFVALRDGSVITAAAASVAQGEAAGCFDLGSDRRIDCAALREAQQRARHQLRGSDAIVRANLIPWLRARLQERTGG